MTPLIALLLATVAAEPRVTGLSVAPVADRTEVMILVDGSVTSRHFMLDDGRIVLDLTGVPQSPRLDIRDFNRGGVRELRVAPFQPGVTRVVIALNRPSAYDVVRESGRIRVTFPNPSGSFDAWTQMLAGATTAEPWQQAPSQQPGTRPAGVQPPQPGTRPTSYEPPPQQQQRQRPITVTFSNEPVNNVLAVFSEYAGRTILGSPEVQAKSITAELRGVPWDQALEAILEANNMSMRLLQSGVYLVEDLKGVNQRRTDEPTITQAFNIQFINADSIRRSIEGLLTPNVGRVTVNSASNALLVTDTRSAVERVRELIPQLDTRTPQVDIAATIAFIDRTALEAFGVSYGLQDNRDISGGIIDVGEGSPSARVNVDGTAVGALANANYRVTGPSLQVLSSIVMGRFTLTSFVEALRSVSMSDIQAKPVIRTMDHRLATIQVGEETPIRVIDAGGGAAAGGAAGAARATVEYKNTGVILEVTPHITGNQVLLDMRAERSNVATAPGDIGIIFQTQNARTQVLVNDGETVVIGGLTIIEKINTRAGIPILMDIPVLGAIFRSTRVQEQKKDLLIMVTPHIVRD